MSRIGAAPITIPAGVSVDFNVDESLVTVKGPKGELIQPISRLLTVSTEENKLSVTRPNNLREARSQHGLARTLINNMVVGVSAGHSKLLDIVGVGYRAAMEGRGLTLNLGYSHPVKFSPIDGITFEVINNEQARTQSIKVSGINKALVGQVAADIRKARRPDPYKGKGVRYQGEVVKLKAGKRAAAKK